MAMRTALVLLLLALGTRPVPGATADTCAVASYSLFDVDREFESDGSRGPFVLSDRPFTEGSERVWVSGRLKERDLDYTADARSARLCFASPIPRGTPIRVVFRQLPQVLRGTYSRRLPPEADAPVAVTPWQSPRPRTKPPAGVRTRGSEASGLQVGGAKNIRVSFGAQPGPALTQSLHIRASGEVSEDVELLAILSDRSLPASSEGGSRSLQELERVFFQVRSPSYSAGLGDQDLALEATAFGRYRRRVGGAYLSADWLGGDVVAFGAVSEGPWRSCRIQTSEGYQGPYLLGGDRGSPEFGVVPGSERVSLDGRLLKRGEGLDYVMDYDRGLLTFTPAHPVSALSRVTVEYQVALGAGRRRVVGVEGSAAFSDDRVMLSSALIRETSASGATREAVPSTGVAPPSAQQVAAISTLCRPYESLSVSGDLAFSVLSAGPGSDDTGAARGGALQLGLEFSPVQARLGGRSLGSLRASGKYRQIQSAFADFGRRERAEDEGRWGWQDPETQGSTQMGEISVQYAPLAGLRLDLGYGRQHGPRAASRREVGVEMSRGRRLFARYRHSAVHEQGGRFVRREGEVALPGGFLRPRLRYAAETAWGSGASRSSVYYAPLLSPGPAPDGVDIKEVAGSLSTRPGGRRAWSSSLLARRLRLLDGAWQDSLQVLSHRHRAELSGWRGLSLLGEYSHNASREPRTQQAFRHTHLSRTRVRYAPGGGALSHEITYRVSHTGVPETRPTFIRVGSGRGRYIWEDVDGDGREDPEEFVADPDGEYEAVYAPDRGFRPAREAALYARLEVSPGGQRSGASGRRHGLSGLVSLDLSVEADHRFPAGVGSVAPWRLLRSAGWPGALSTRHEVLARLHLMRYRARGSLLGWLRRREAMDQAYADGTVEDLGEVGIRGRFRVGRAIDLEGSLKHLARHRHDASAFGYAAGAHTAELGGSWRLTRVWQAHLRTVWGREREAVRGLRLTRISVDPQVHRALPGRGRVRASAGWTRVAASAPLPLFLGLAGGYREGQSLQWRVAVDYRLARHLTAQMAVDGRKRPEYPVRHSGHMEMRASF